MFLVNSQKIMLDYKQVFIIVYVVGDMLFRLAVLLERLIVFKCKDTEVK